MTYGTNSYSSTPYGTSDITPNRYDPIYNIRYSNTRILRSTPPELVPIIKIIEMPANGSTSTEVIVVDDINITRNTVTPASNNYNLNILRSSYNQDYDLVNATPLICTLDNSGNVARITDGTSKIIIYTPYHILNYLRTFSNTSTVITYTWNSWTPGSLGAHIDSSVRAMIAGKTAGASTQAVLSSTSGGATTPNHIRNTNLFTGSLDLSAISVYSTAFDSNMFPVVLISPRHVIAGHVGVSPSQQVVFKAPNGTYEVRTVVSQAQIPLDTGENYIGYLDSEITTITPMKLLPTTWEQHLPALTQMLIYPTLPALNKGWTAGDYIRILNANRSEELYVGYHQYLYLSPSTDSEFQSWSSAIIGGDSNGPVFFPINGQPVLLHCMNYPGGGAFYPDNSSNIQATVTSLGPGSITYADLSLFPTY